VENVPSDKHHEAAMSESLMQRLYDSEINFAVSASTTTAFT
jgi:hypothetical protein